MADITVTVQEPPNLTVSLNDAVVIHGATGTSINEMLEGIDGQKVLFQATYHFASVLVGVYLNGLKLVQADYSIIQPDKILLTEAPLIGDILEIDYIK